VVELLNTISWRLIARCFTAFSGEDDLPMLQLINKNLFGWRIFMSDSPHMPLVQKSSRRWEQRRAGRGAH
jgi:hypothetical protein